MAITISPNGRVAVLSDEQVLEDALNNNIVLPSLFKISAKGAKFNVFGINGKIISVEADDAIARWTNPTVAMEDALAVFVNAEVANGNWGTNASNYTDSLYDLFYLFGGVNSDVNALTDLHQVLKLTAVNNGATRVGDGWDFDGLDDFVDSNYNPSTQAVNYLTKDAQISLYVATNDDIGEDHMLMGTTAGGATRLRTEFDNNSGFINQSAPLVTSVEFADNLLTLLTNATNEQLFINGVLEETRSEAAIGVPSEKIFIGARNNADVGGFFFDGVISTFQAGATIGFDQVGYNTNLRAMLTSLGVLP